nr:TonB-dependent receptor [Novosphingobium huizhouense]
MTALAVAAGAPLAAQAETGERGAASLPDRSPPPEQIVVSAPGGDVDRDDALTLDRAAIARAGRPDLLGALSRDIAGITLQDVQGNPWQPTLAYRGYLASPLQGEAQGLAVYLDGGRFNQPFGDTVGFDLLPDAAIAKVTLLDSSPVFGFNALGGALVIETATGRSDPGFAMTLSGGNYGRREASVSAGGAGDRFSWFLAGQNRREDGWRDHSPSQLANLFADLGLDAPGVGGLHAKLLLAESDLTGNGAAPVELLAARRSAVYTWPDRSRSRYARASLHPTLVLGRHSRIEATLYGQIVRLRGLNGDTAEIDPCLEDSSELCAEDLNDEEALLPGIGISAAKIRPARAPIYGVLNRAALRTRSGGVLVQLIDQRPLLAGTNRLAVGMSRDAGTTRFSTAVEVGLIGEDRQVTGTGLDVAPGGPIGPVALSADNGAWGLFLSDTLPLLPGLAVELGLRWNSGTIRLEDHLGDDLDGSHRYRRLNPGIEFDWKVGRALTLRAGYAETNRMPTPAELSCADEEAPCSLANFFVADPHLEQVVARSLEAGAAVSASLGGWTVDGLLSLYRTVNQNDIQHVASRVPGRSWFTNIGRTRRQGLDASLKLARDGWRIAASYAFADATSLSALTLSSPQNPGADPVTGTIPVRRGDRLPGIPRHSATLSVDFTASTFGLGGDLVARSSQVLRGDAANLVPPVPGYLIANLRAHVALSRGLALTGEVQNLFDRRYATFGTFGEIDKVPLPEAPDATSSRFAGPGAPRRWTVGLAATF